jgi:hypothetical protein
MLVIFADVTAELETSAGEPGGEYFEHEGRLLFEHVQKYQGLYRSVLQSRDFTEKLKGVLSRGVEDHIQRHARGLDELAFPLELAAHHMVVALIGLIEWWLEHDLPLPAQEMARIYERLIIQATWYALPARNRLPLPWDS